MKLASPDKRPLAKPTAFLSDIHGNFEALSAVLEELGRRDVGQFVVCGDSFLGGPQPLEVYRAIERAALRIVRGLSDSALVEVDPADVVAPTPEARARLEAFRETRAALGDLALHQIRKWPEKVRIPLIDGRELLVVHGSPADPRGDLSHDMEDAELGAALADEVADLVVCGSSHVPFRIPLGEIEVLSVGSVGAAPEGRVAHFAVVTPRMNGAEIMQTFVDY
jgi:predicted phosphodiesterase